MSPEDALRFDLMEWPCGVCGEQRPDAKIDVAYRPLRGLETAFPETRFNLKYCNDNPNCIAVALDPGPWPPEKA